MGQRRARRMRGGWHWDLRRIGIVSMWGDEVGASGCFVGCGRCIVGDLRLGDKLMIRTVGMNPLAML